jgi:hypothetical protein
MIILQRRGISLTRAVLSALFVVGALALLVIGVPRGYASSYTRIWRGEIAVSSLSDFIFHDVHHSARFILESLGGEFAIRTWGDREVLGPSIFILSFVLGWLFSRILGRPSLTYVAVVIVILTGLLVFPILASISLGETLSWSIVPRYISPFAVASIGLLVYFAPNAKRLLEQRNGIDRFLLLTATVSYASALHISLRLRITGQNVEYSVANLNRYTLFWPSISIAPLTVWFLALVAYVGFLLMEMSRKGSGFEHATQ